MLKRFGFRTVLVSNAVLSAIFIAACAAFPYAMPYWLMIAILVAGGFFRSLQFTAVNAIAYAEIPQERMSRATSLAAVGQQVSLSTGVAIGALTVELMARSNGGGAIGAMDFPAAFMTVGLIAGAAALVFWRLPKDAGADMADRAPTPTEPSDQRVG